MKKKLFLAVVIVAILSCIFAISISAEDTDPNADYYDRVYKAVDGTDLALYDKETVDGVTTYYPLVWFSYDITNDAGEVVETKYVKARYQDCTIRTESYSQGRFNAASYSYTDDNGEVHALTNANIVLLNLRDSYVVSGTNTKITQKFESNTKDPAFSRVEAIFFPTTISSISSGYENAFPKAQLVDIPENITSTCTIAKKVFYQNKSLKEIYLPSKISFGNDNSHFMNTSIEKVTFGPNYSGKIPSNCFKNCSELKEFNQNGAKFTQIDGGAFSGCSNSNLELILDFSYTTSIGESAFYNCKNFIIKDNSLPAIKSIGKEVFKGFNITKINSNVDGVFIFPEGFETMGHSSFYGNQNIEYVKFPSTLKKIDAQAFRDCKNLTFIEFGNNENALEMPNFGVFYNCTSLKAISLPKNTKSIPERCFYNCTALTAVYLGEKVVSFGSNADGQGAFDNCSQMYFVQNAFSVLKDDGTFPTTEEYVAPEKPAIYYMPESLTTLRGHVEKDFGYNSGSTVVGTFFKNCTSLNETIVFGTAFIYIPSCNIFHSAGTEASPKTIVFLADIQGSVTLTNSKYISYVFVNPADKSPADLGIVAVYPNYNNTESYMYFCATGLKYTYGLELSDLDDKNDNKFDQSNDNTNKKYSNAYNAAYALEYEAAIAAGNDETTAKAIATERATATAIAEEAKWIALAISAERNPATEGTKHVHNKDLDSTQEATCLLPAGKFTFCFCGAIMTKEIVEGSEALGHSDLNAIVEYYYKNNNYFEASYKKYICTREGCGEVIDSQEGGIPALFKAMGMTVPDYGISALCHAIKIETDAVKEYNAYLGEGNEIKYGVLAGVVVDGNKPVGADGKSNCDAIVMGFESTNFSIVQLKLTGLEKANKQLYCGAYAVVDGTVSYLYEGTVSEYATPLTVNNGILDQTTPEATVEETKEN